MKFEVRFVRWLDRECEVNPMLLQRCYQSTRVARFNTDSVLRKTLFELTQDWRNQVLAGGGACTESQTSAPPLAQFAERRSRVIHFTQNFLRVMQKLFARLCKRNLFAQPVQKPTAHIALQRLHRVADGGLS